LPNGIEEGKPYYYLLRIVAILHLRHDPPANTYADIAVASNGRTGLSPLVIPQSAGQGGGVAVNLLDLGNGGRWVHTRGAQLKVDEVNYGVIGDVHGGQNEFRVAVEEPRGRAVVSAVELSPATGVYATRLGPAKLAVGAPAKALGTVGRRW
jgi:hypothetical protein